MRLNLRAFAYYKTWKAKGWGMTENANETEVEQPVEDDQGGWFDYDFSTLSGAARAVRPGGTMMIVVGLFNLFWSVIALLRDQSLSSALANEASATQIASVWDGFFLGLFALIAIYLGAMIFFKSRIAALLALLYVALRWLDRILVVTNGGNLLDQWRGLIFDGFLTYTVYLAVEGTFAYHKHKKSEVSILSEF